MILALERVFKMETITVFGLMMIAFFNSPDKKAVNVSFSIFKTVFSMLDKIAIEPITGKPLKL